MKNKSGRRAQYSLFRHQKQFAESTKPFPALVGGLGCGKTDAGIFRFLRLMYKNRYIYETTGKRYKFGIYMPNNSYLKDPIIPRFELILKQLGHRVDVNKTDFTIKIDDHSMIVMKSLDNPDKIVSFEVHDSWIDELDTMKYSKAEKAFRVVLSRNRFKKPNGDDNTLCITTTPEGFKFVYQTWVKDLEDKPELAEDYEIIKGKTKWNIHLPPNYLIKNFSKYSKKMYLAYAEGEFINFTSDPVYAQYDRKINDTKREWQGEPLAIGMDFNINNMSAVVGIVEGSGRNKRIDIVDEIFESSVRKKNIRDTNEMILEIKKRYPNADITIYPDAAGSQKTAAQYNSTSVMLLKKEFKVKLNYKTSPNKPQNPRINDRVMTVNSSFLNIANKTRLYVNSDKCRQLVQNLENQSYKEQGSDYVPDKGSGQDHMLDALGYVVFFELSDPSVRRQVVSSKMF